MPRSDAKGLLLSTVSELKAKVSKALSEAAEKDTLIDSLKVQNARKATEYEGQYQPLQSEMAAKESRARSDLESKGKRIAPKSRLQDLLLSTVSERDAVIEQLNTEADQLSAQIRAIATTADELQETAGKHLIDDC